MKNNIEDGSPTPQEQELERFLILANSGNIVKLYKALSAIDTLETDEEKNRAWNVVQQSTRGVIIGGELAYGMKKTRDALHHAATVTGLEGTTKVTTAPFANVLIDIAQKDSCVRVTGRADTSLERGIYGIPAIAYVLRERFGKTGKVEVEQQGARTNVSLKLTVS